jgi:glycosyltransferase involved in cell wall biosynthesis
MVFEVRDLWPGVPIAVGALKGPLIPLARWLERFAYRHSSEIIALSPGMKTGIINMGCLSDRVHIIPNSADLNMFSISEREGDAFRKKYHWLQDRPLVVYTGAMGLINGVDYLVRLAAEVYFHDIEIRFLVVGDGSEGHKILDMARQLNVYERNFFIMPSQPKENMPVILSAADIATSLVIDLPELWDNSANKFFDGLAAGTPLAINYLGWQAELLQETGAGIVLNPKIISVAASELIALLRDKNRLNKAGQAARRLAEESFSRDELAKTFEEVLVAATLRKCNF